MALEGFNWSMVSNFIDMVFTGIITSLKLFSPWLQKIPAWVVVLISIAGGYLIGRIDSVRRSINYSIIIFIVLIALVLLLIRGV